MHKFHNPVASGGALADASGGALADASGGAGALPDASARGIDASARGARCLCADPLYLQLSERARGWYSEVFTSPEKEKRPTIHYSHTDPTSKRSKVFDKASSAKSIVAHSER
jgi:hypothetical protein